MSLSDFSNVTMTYYSAATAAPSQSQKIFQTPWPKNLGLHWSFLVWYFATCLQEAVKRQTA